MNSDKLNTIKGTFSYYLADEQRILTAFTDEKAYNTTIDIVDRIYASGALKSQTQFIKVNGKENFLSINMILKDHVKLQRLTIILNKIVGNYEHSSLEKYESNDGNCSYKLVIYDFKKKSKPLLVFNIVHPVLQQYDLIPMQL